MDNPELVTELRALSKERAKMLAEEMFRQIEDSDRTTGLDHFVEALLYQIYLFHKGQ